MNYVKIYFKSEAMKIAKERQMRYAALWMDNFINKLFKENDLISIELIKNNIDSYYKGVLSK